MDQSSKSNIGDNESYPLGHIIFRENEFSKDIYLIKEGVVAITKKVGSHNLHLSTVEKGGILGEVAMLDGGPRTATATCMEFTKVVRISPSAFKTKFEVIPKYFQKIGKILANRLRETDKRLDDDFPLLNNANMCFLLVYYFVASKNENQELKKEYIEKELKEMLQITFKEVNTFLDSLEEKELIGIEKNMIHVKDLKALESLGEELKKKASEVKPI